MPYNPGITDISGQLLGRGMESAAQARAQGINAISNAFTDTFKSIQQNKFLNDANLAKFQGAASANPDMLQFLSNAGNTEDPNAPKLDPKIVKAFANVRDGKADVYDTSLLASFSDSYSKGKDEAQKRALITAQLSDVNAQAALRQAQADREKRKFDLMQGFLQQQGSAATGGQQSLGNLPQAPIPQTDAGAAAGKDEIATKASELHSQADAAAPTPNVSNRDPFFNPTQSAPKPHEATIALMRAGVDPFDHPEMVVQLHKDNVDRWAKTERPLGYIVGGIETDKDGNRLTQYFPVTVNNSGDIKQGTQPIKIYEGHPAPGTILDGSTYKPTAVNRLNESLKTNPGAQIAEANRPPLIKQAKEDITTASNNVNTIDQALAQLQKMKAISADMEKKRWAAASGITGGYDFMNNVVEPMLGDTTGQQFNSLAASFKADVMSNVRNVRNLYEFKAVTGNVPDAGQAPETRNQLIAALEEKLVRERNRNANAVQLMQNGVDPDSAWANSNMDEAKKTTVGKAPTIGPAQPKPLTPASKSKEAAPTGEVVLVTTQEQYDALPPGTPYHDSKGNRAVKGKK